MSRNYPVIDLNGFERLRDVERRIFYSPTAILLTLIGLGGGVYLFWSLRLGVEVFPQSFLIGYGIFLASYLGLLAYFYLYRFRRLACTSCGQRMQPFAADLDEGGWRRFIRAVQIDGRYYRQPFDADDVRPSVRLMKLVRACPPCGTFVDCSRLLQETCTEEELAQIRGRAGAT
jgi:hypothetical protein